MAEWIEFHRLVGVERFFLFNNRSTDDHREVLAPYVEEGIVVVEDWPGKSPEFAQQARCNFHCVEQHRHETRWLAFIDLDEYLFSPTYRPVPELLGEYEHAAALWVSRPAFGSSGHRTKPPGLVTESYTRRADQEAMNMKRIVDPKRVIKAGMNLANAYEGGGPSINTDNEHVQRPVQPPLLDKLRLNHYFTKSEEEARIKAMRLRANDGKPQLGLQRRLAEVLASLDQVTDTTIQPYVPSLREALAARRGHIGV